MAISNKLAALLNAARSKDTSPDCYLRGLLKDAHALIKADPACDLSSDPIGVYLNQDNFEVHKSIYNHFDCEANWWTQSLIEDWAVMMELRNKILSANDENASLTAVCAEREAELAAVEDCAKKYDKALKDLDKARKERDEAVKERDETIDNIKAAMKIDNGKGKRNGRDDTNPKNKTFKK